MSRKIIIYQIIFMPIILMLLLNCAKTTYQIDIAKEQKYPDCRFAVISDIHYYDISLGIKGNAFENYLLHDRKLLELSAEIFDSTLSEISNEDLDFIIVCGDMTKDGELINHEKVSENLSRFDNVFVIPGNHDICNPHAFSFIDNNKVPNIDKNGFENIYENMGYNKAFSKDSFSLSYAAEPIQGLILIGLDCNIYGKSFPSPPVGGYINKKTIKWLTSILDSISLTGKPIICFTHHPVIDHFEGMKKYFPDYVLRNNKKLIDIFLTYNIKIVFTGHYHANDITMYKTNKGSFYDIGTGSTVTFPCPYRIIDINNNKMHINTYFIESLSKIENLYEYSRNYVKVGIENIASEKLRSFGVNSKDIDIIKTSVSKAFAAYYEGDEEFFNVIDFSKLSLFGKIIAFTQKDIVANLVNDLYPADLNIVIDLNK